MDGDIDVWQACALVATRWFLVEDFVLHFREPENQHSKMSSLNPDMKTSQTYNRTMLTTTGNV